MPISRNEAQEKLETSKISLFDLIRTEIRAARARGDQYFRLSFSELQNRSPTIINQDQLVSLIRTQILDLEIKLELITDDYLYFCWRLPQRNWLRYWNFSVLISFLTLIVMAAIRDPRDYGFYLSTFSLILSGNITTFFFFNAFT